MLPPLCPIPHTRCPNLQSKDMSYYTSLFDVLSPWELPHSDRVGDPIQSTGRISSRVSKIAALRPYSERTKFYGVVSQVSGPAEWTKDTTTGEKSALLTFTVDDGSAAIEMAIFGKGVRETLAQ